MLNNRSTNTRAIGVSVVMAVYKNDRASWVRQAIDSVLNQTLQPDEVIVVVDGEIPKGIQKVLDSYSGGGVKQIPLDENRGLWNALNVGIAAAKHELIARMDADDIALPDRFEKQIREFHKDSDLVLLGGQVAEFTTSPDVTISYRKVPESLHDIRQFAKLRSPFNHPTVIFRKKKVIEAGGYHEFYRTEDYDLWTRMLQAGMKMRNLPDVLLNYRIGHSNYGRKNSEIQHREAIVLQKRLLASGFLSQYEYLVARFGRAIFYHLPGYMKHLVYKRILRED